MKNTSLSEKLIELKEKIIERISQIDKSKGRLSMLQDGLEKLGFKNIEQAQTRLKKIQFDLEEKEKVFDLKVKKLEERVKDK